MTRSDHITREEMLARQRKPVSAATGAQLTRGGVVRQVFNLRALAKIREIKEEVRKAKEQ